MSNTRDYRTDDERVALLELLAWRALDSYDLDVDGVSLITNDWNCVFRMDLHDGSRLVMRVSLPNRRTRAEVEGEMAWLASLAGGPVPVPTPVRARNGDFAIEAGTVDVPEPRTCAVFGWLEGTQLADTMTPQHIGALGVATARLHLQASSFPAPPGMKTWNSPYPFLEQEVLFGNEYAPLVDPGARASFMRARARTMEAVARLRAAEHPRMIHADLHEDNAFVLSDGRIAVLDFDDSMLGWPVQDLGITVWALAAHDGFDELEHALREGYEQVARWPEREAGEVRVFAASRSLMMSNYFVQHRDPEQLTQDPQMLAKMLKEDVETIDRLIPG